MSLDKSIFRERAIEKYMRRREINVILRLVSPPMFLILWILLLLAVCGGAVVWSIQVPILVQGKGIVVQEAAPTATNAKAAVPANAKQATPAAAKPATQTNVKQPAQQITVLLLLPSDQQENIKAGQPVTISIVGTDISFTSTIAKVQAGVMNPADIRTQFNLSAALSQTVAGPSVVASAPVQPASLGQTYLGSQCQVQVKVGSQSALSIMPIFSTSASYLNAAHKVFDAIYKEVVNLL